jgi:O-antigen/teichoic acid export membrane protein
LKDILKGSAVIFLFKAVGAASLFGVHLLIARHYGASTLGVFNLVLALLTFGTIFSRLGLDMYVIRVLPGIENDKTLVAGFIQKTFKLLFVGSIVSMLFLMISSSLINQNIFKSFDASDYLIVLAVLVIPFTYFSVIPEIFRGFQDIKIYSFYRNLAQNLLVLLILAFFINFLNITLDPVWVLYVVLFVVTIVMAYHLYNFLKEKNISLFSKGNYKENILINSYPMLFTSSMMFLMGNVDSLMISYYLDEHQVGIYSAIIKLSLAITFILASVNNYILPKISKAYSSGEIDKLVKLYQNSIKLIVFSTFPVIITMLLYPSFFLGLFGEEFKSYTNVFYVVLLMSFIFVLIGPVINILNMINQQLYVKNIIFIALILNISLNFVLIPFLGILGAAVATMISTLAWKLLGFVKLKQEIKKMEGNGAL